MTIRTSSYALSTTERSTESASALGDDQLGSTRLLTDEGGEKISSQTYDPYGEVVGRTGTATSALGFAGQYTLDGTGLQYLHARFYDPATAQFMSVDPAVETSGEPYGYATEDPVNRRDLSGEASEGVEGGYCPLCLPFPGTSETEAALGAIEELPGEVEGFGSAIAGGLSDLWGLANQDAEEDGESVAPGPDCIFPEIGPDGKVHGKPLPGYVNPDWTPEDLEQIREDLEKVWKSAANRWNSLVRSPSIATGSGKRKSCWGK